MQLAFLIGTGRCGSTLVHEVLARHQGTGFVSNIEDNLAGLNRVGRWNRVLYRSPLGWRTRKGGIRFAPSEGYRIITREVSALYANSCRDLVADDVTPWLAHRFRHFFAERAAAQGVDLFLHKYTGWPRVGFFHSIFPDARFVHIVRDGRAVANSWLQMPWWNGYRGPENWLWGTLPEELESLWQDEGRSFVALAGIGWNLLMRSMESAMSELPAEQKLVIRFEDLVADPVDGFRALLEFVGVDASPEFLRSLSRYRFSVDRHRAFERDLDPSQIDCLNRVTGPILQRYNYD